MIGPNVFKEEIISNGNMQYHYFIYVNLFSCLKEDMCTLVVTACIYMCMCFPVAFGCVD